MKSLRNLYRIGHGPSSSHTIGPQRIAKFLKEKYQNLKITRLARGLPLGVDLSYADQITLSAALENRTTL